MGFAFRTDNVRVTSSPEPHPGTDSPAPEFTSQNWEAALRLRREGRYEEALGFLEDAGRNGASLSADGRRLRASIRRDWARESRRLGQIDLAASILVRALADAPEFPDLHHELGISLLERGDAAGARSSFLRALSIAPGFVGAAIEIVFLEARAGRLGEALVSLQRLGEAHPAGNPALFRKGIENLRHGAWETAGDRIRAAYGDGGVEWEERSKRLGRLLAADQTSPALEAARLLAGDFPDFPDSHVALGLCFLQLQWWDDAIEAFTRSLSLHPAYHEARVHLARALFGSGDTPAGEEELSRVLSLCPGHELALGLERERRHGGLGMSSSPADRS
jgi:tetratricopeptide (TPR) repeat protein